MGEALLELESESAEHDVDEAAVRTGTEQAGIATDTETGASGGTSTATQPQGEQQHDSRQQQASSFSCSTTCGIWLEIP